MSHPRALRKFCAAPAWERLLLMEAVCWLGLMRVAIKLFPFRWIVRRFHLAPGKYAGNVNVNEQSHAARIGHTIRIAAEHTPWKCNCFTQSLAAMAMLRRRGLAGTLFLGVARAGDAITAHSWLCSGDTMLTGGAVEQHFTPVACFTWNIDEQSDKSD